MEQVTEEAGDDNQIEIVDGCDLAGDIAVDACYEILLECLYLGLDDSRLHVDVETLHFKFIIK